MTVCSNLIHDVGTKIMILETKSRTLKCEKSKNEKTGKCDANSIAIEAEVCTGRLSPRINKEPGC